jgi:predicted NodU family carbamoyl transferase
MLTLGIWAFGRDSSAVLVNDSFIVAAVEEEKLSRSTGMGGIPRMAISRCLERRNAKITDIQLDAFPAGLPFPPFARLAFGSATCFPAAQVRRARSCSCPRQYLLQSFSGSRWFPTRAKPFAVFMAPASTPPPSATSLS